MANQTPLRVLGLTRYDRRGASSRVRLLQYLSTLARRGVLVEPRPLLDDGYLEALYSGGPRPYGAIATAYVRRLRALRAARRFDLVWLQKEALPYVPALLEAPLLPPFVLDIDDAWYLRYQASPRGAVRFTLGSKLDVLMARARLVVAGNRHLAEYARRAGASNVEVVPSVVPVERYDPSAPFSRGHGLVIGWIGSPATVHYLEMLRPVFERLAVSGPVTVRVVGAPFAAGRNFDVDAREWSEATEANALRDIDVGVMPLEATPWELGKCAYKLVQYMAAGRPVVASRVGANEEVVVAGETGFLVADEGGWVEALETLRSAELRDRMGRAGRLRAESRYSVEVQAPRLVELFRSAAETA